MKRLIILSGLLVLLDQATKFFFSGKHFEILSFFSLTYVENTGAAFGVLKGFNFMFVMLSLFVIIGILLYYKQYPIPLTFILAGTIGNLIDRLAFGFVRDFISVSVWPVFNFADAYNTIGVILLLYAFYLEEKTYKRRGHKKE